MLSSLYILISQSIYSQTSEVAKSLNCKDNKDQSLYVRNVLVENNSDKVGPVTDDLPGFHYVKKFDSNGTLISACGTKGTGPGQFLHAHGIIVDSNGYVYVSDAEKCNIQKFDSEGNFITMWGSKGTADGQLMFPHSIDLASDWNAYVIDTGNKRIQKFSSDGKYVTKWGSEGTGDGQFKGLHVVAVDPSSDFVYTS